jgi:hypothetical protein
MPRRPIALPAFAASPHGRIRSAQFGAVVHTIVVSLYSMQKQKEPYHELGADFLDRRNAENVKRYLLKRLKRLGLHVTVRSAEDTEALLA